MSLITKHRPRNFSEVVGQETAVKVLEGLVKRGEAHAFLLSGPAGTGKTSLARIVARALGILDKDMLTIAAAVKTGVGDMRDVLELTLYAPLGKGSGRAIILDEAHRLSANAWDSLLLAIEEPQKHVYWFLCTTDPRKIPATIKQRCADISLKPVPDKVLGTLYDRVCKVEKINLPGDVGDLIIREANGSPRQMLANLDVCRDVSSLKDAANQLKKVLDTEPVIELARFLLNGGGSWAKVAAILVKLKEEPPESVRIVVVNYIAGCIRNAKAEKEVCHLLSVLEAFATPYNPAEGQAPLLLSVGRVLYSGN